MPWVTHRGPDSPCSTAPHPPSWSGSGSTTSTSCPPSKSSCPDPRSSSNSRSACAPAPMPDREGERLQKVLARIGLGSRRACEELIVDGRGTVNGGAVALGRCADVEVDVVALDGVPLPVLPGLVHYLLHKPAGVVTTAHDPFGRPTVLELVPDAPRVFPVGRLDADSEGLLVLT